MRTCHVVLPVFLCALSAAATVHRVGPGRTYTDPGGVTDTTPKRWAVDTSRYFIRDAKFGWRDVILCDLFAMVTAFQDACSGKR